MDAIEVKDQLQMIDRIIATADRTVRFRGVIFIVWGLLGAGLNLLNQSFVNGSLSPNPWAFLGIAGWLGAVVYTIFYVRGAKTAGCLNVTEMQFLRILYIALGCAMVVNIGAYNLFTGWAQGAIWSLASAIPLMFVGLQGPRVALYGGLILLGSIVAANFAGHSAGYMLALGDIVGYAGLGVALELKHRG